jgi:threonine dehydrogenase-like Zn-dependent dehydrogenase
VIFAITGIGWIFGQLIDGTQAEYVRVPFAERSMHKLPARVSDEAAVVLSDSMPTGFEIGVRNGKVQPGDVVAVVGAGPVGLSAMMTAGLYGASRVIAIDQDENCLAQAKTRSGDPNAYLRVPLRDVDPGTSRMQQFHDADLPDSTRLVASVAGRAGISEESDSRALTATIHGSRGALHRHAELQAHRHYRRFGVQPRRTSTILTPLNYA